jgi:hypothetical protein
MALAFREDCQSVRASRERDVERPSALPTVKRFVLRGLLYVIQRLGKTYPQAICGNQRGAAI